MARTIARWTPGLAALLALAGPVLAQRGPDVATPPETADAAGVSTDAAAPDTADAAGVAADAATPETTDAATPEPAEEEAPVFRPVSLPPNPYGLNTDSSDSLGGRRYNGFPETQILEALRRGRISNTRQVGNTSINFYCDFPGDVDGSYKPSETLHVEHYRSEIAAFRVNQLLGLERVPPAVLRRVTLQELPAGRTNRVLFRNGVAVGAMIYWVPVLRLLGIFSGPAVERWTNALIAGAPIPPDQRRRVEEISTLVVFDYIIGNWDRWHGTNTLVDGQGRMVYRDNNGGFLEPMPRWKAERMLSFLQRVQRFSRTLIDRARALTYESLVAAIAPDADEGRPLLNERQLRAVMQRRDTLIQYVDALVQIHGEDEVYAFP